MAEAQGSLSVCAGLQWLHRWWRGTNLCHVSVSRALRSGREPQFQPGVALATTDPREHCREQLRAGPMAAGTSQLRACQLPAFKSAARSSQLPWATQTLCELRLDVFCIPQPPWRLGKARWSSADGCHPELQPGGPGGLLQLAGMRWAIDGKSLSLLASFFTVGTCSCACREFAAGNILNALCTFFLATCRISLGKLSFLSCVFSDVKSLSKA